MITSITFIFQDVSVLLYVLEKSTEKLESVNILITIEVTIYSGH